VKADPALARSLWNALVYRLPRQYPYPALAVYGRNPSN
jgi:hypothetical protein